MEKEQAIQIIKQICSVYKGTLDEHKIIQEAIITLEKEKEVNKDDSGKTPNK